MALTNDFKVKNGLTVVDSITAGGNLSASEGYFIDNLGIGINQPGYKAHIMVDNSSLALSAANGIRIENDSPGVGTMSVAHFRSNTQDWYIGNRNCSSTSNFFFTHENYEVLTIEGGGKVGIGTTTPNEKLTVAGSISAQNSVCVGATTNGFVSAGRDLADIFAGGDITSVTAGNYLTGGADTGDVVIGLDSSCAAKWDNSSAGGVTSVGAAAPLSSSGGLTPTICLYESCDTNWSNTYTTVQANSASWAQGTIDGSGTSGKLPIWSDTDTLSDSILSANGSCVYLDGSLGIGIDDPDEVLEVKGIIKSENTGYTNTGFIINQTSHSDAWRLMQFGGGSFSLNLNGYTSGESRFQVNTSGDVVIPAGTLTVTGTGDSSIAGNVGIGTTSPTNKLDIRPTTSGGSDVVGTGAITIGSDNPYWTFRGTATSLQYLAFDRCYSGTWYESMRIQRSTGNVGIGTTNPLAQLHVNQKY